MTPMPMLIALAALAAAFMLWAGRRKPRPSAGGAPSRDWRLLGGAAIVIALAGALTYAQFRQRAAPDEIERYIAVYPGAAGLLWVPTVGDSGHWFLETADGLRQVGDFYEAYSKAQSWKLDRTEARDLLHLRLRKGRLVVQVIGTRREGRSQLVYRIVDRGVKRRP